MCKSWQIGKKCSFGQSCNYAHGQAQLDKYTEISNKISEQEAYDLEHENYVGEASDLPQKAREHA